MTHYVLPIEHLQELSQEILASSDPVVIEDRLRRIIKFYGIYNVVFGYDAPFLRGRKCNGPEGFANIREVHYPPAAVTKAGRLNDSGKPMLYVSKVQFSVLEEIQAEAGDFVHFISYGLQKRHVRAAFIGEFTHVQRWGRTIFAEAAGPEINRVFKGMEFQTAKAFVFTDAFLASLLRDKNASKDDYIRSRSVARLLFEKMPELEAIIYQGVALEGSFNMALKPDVADRVLYNGATFVLRVTRRYDHGIYDFEPVNRAKGYFADGTIDWGAPTKRTQ